jgi:hypothetical protein
MGLESTAIATTIQAVRALVTVYDGYEKGRFMKSDEAVRAEIQRRCEMLIRHGEKLEQDAHRRGHRGSRMACSQAIESLESFRREAQFSTTANHVSKHKGIGKLKSASVRKLVDHDSESLQSLVEATRKANEVAHGISGISEQEGLEQISQWEQKINRARNHFLERNMFIDGLTKR